MPKCPDCSNELEYVDEYDRWYCDSCEEYQEPAKKQTRSRTPPPPPGQTPRSGPPRPQQQQYPGYQYPQYGGSKATNFGILQHPMVQARLWQIIGIAIGIFGIQIIIQGVGYLWIPFLGLFCFAIAFVVGAVVCILGFIIYKMNTEKLAANEIY